MWLFSGETILSHTTPSQHPNIPRQDTEGAHKGAPAHTEACTHICTHTHTHSHTIKYQNTPRGLGHRLFFFVSRTLHNVLVLNEAGSEDGREEG